MAYQCKVSSWEFVEPPADPSSGSASVRVRLEDGKQSVFSVATIDAPGRWLKEGKGGYRLGKPVLFVRSLSGGSVTQALNWMAADMGGFWLRYYNSEKRPAAPAPVAQEAKKPARRKG
ncbi:MAG: hypothetical protein HY924_02900 [Elusimicrobia bacterium]|nr:hypothetical protein [Elusimicrobiota bacterium]